MDETPKLSHEKLHVYQKSIELLALSTHITSSPRGNGELVDQHNRQWGRGSGSCPRQSIGRRQWRWPWEIDGIYLLYYRVVVFHAARDVNDLIVPPGNRLGCLKGDSKGFYSIRINDQWRIVFKFEGGNASEVSVEDYHS